MTHKKPTLTKTAPDPHLSSEHHGSIHKLGFEVWQILTVFTVLFTLATTIIWFNWQSPSKTLHAYEVADSLKVSSYNLHLQNQVIQKQIETLRPTYTLSKPCYSEITQIIPSNNAALLETITRNEKKVDQLTEQYREIAFFDEEKTIAKALQAVNQESLQQKIYLSQAASFDTTIVPLQQLASRICQADFHPTSEQKELTRTALSNLTSQSPLVTSDWIETYTTWFQALEQESPSPENLSAYLETIVNAQFDATPYVGFLEQSALEYTQTLATIEAWQQKLVRENEFLQNKATFIL
jgi:hypothetical protein